MSKIEWHTIPIIFPFSPCGEWGHQSVSSKQLGVLLVISLHGLNPGCSLSLFIILRCISLGCPIIRHLPSSGCVSVGIHRTVPNPLFILFYLGHGDVHRPQTVWICKGNETRFLKNVTQLSANFVSDLALKYNISLLRWMCHVCEDCDDCNHWKLGQSNENNNTACKIRQFDDTINQGINNSLLLLIPLLLLLFFYLKIGFHW